MRRPVEVRTAPRRWITLLKGIYPSLRGEGLADLTLYGSQVLSVYMRTPLRSKDLDLLSANFGPRHLDILSSKLQAQGIQTISTMVQTRPLEFGRLTTYSVELRLDGKPFFVEIFDRILDGRPLSFLTPYMERAERWGIQIWAPDRNATLCLRLAFRPPEGLSPLNAQRLNRFIAENRRKIDFEEVRRILEDWQMENCVERNLSQLYQRHRIRILKQEEIVPEIGKRK